MLRLSLQLLQLLASGLSHYRRQHKDHVKLAVSPSIAASGSQGEASMQVLSRPHNVRFFLGEESCGQLGRCIDKKI